jgi:hypothetical protein
MIGDRGATDRRHDPHRAAARSIETSPSGSFRVKVYAGFDLVSGKRYYLDEVVPAAGRRAAAEAERSGRGCCTRATRRNPKTQTTVDQLLDRDLERLRAHRLAGVLAVE